MSRRGALAEDLRRLGLALIIAAIVGGFFQDEVAAGVAYAGLVLGAALWITGLLTTEEVMTGEEKE